MTKDEIRTMLRQLDERIRRLEERYRCNRKYDNSRYLKASEAERYTFRLERLKSRCKSLIERARKASRGELASWVRDSTYKYAVENDGWMPLGRAFEGLINGPAFMVSNNANKTRMTKGDFLKFVEKFLREETDWEIATPSVSLARFGAFKTYVRIPFQEEEV
jgi:hypothetical protein